MAGWGFRIIMIIAAIILGLVYFFIYMRDKGMSIDWGFFSDLFRNR